MPTWIVILANNAAYYGPFESWTVAAGFAEFLRVEVDPAEVHRLQQPIDEVLAWFKATDRRVDSAIADIRDSLGVPDDSGR